MANAWSKKRPVLKDVFHSLAIGCEVRRKFSAHELGTGSNGPQWIDGVVHGSQSGGGKGKKQKEKWWRVNFNPPARDGLLCSTADLGEMRISWLEYRDKYSRLRMEIGKELTVQWTAMDETTCLQGSKMTLRNCTILMFLPAVNKYVLRYRCGHEKMVSEEELVHLVGESDFHKGATRRTIEGATRC